MSADARGHRILESTIKVHHHAAANLLYDSYFMNLGRFPRLRFAHLPTPLERLANLSRSLGGPEIWMNELETFNV